MIGIWFVSVLNFYWMRLLLLIRIVPRLSTVYLLKAHVIVISIFIVLIQLFLMMIMLLTVNSLISTIIQVVIKQITRIVLTRKKHRLHNTSSSSHTPSILIFLTTTILFNHCVKLKNIVQVLLDVYIVLNSWSVWCAQQ